MQREYPKWLQVHSGELTEEQRRQYTAQQAHVNAVCRHLDEHGDSKFEELQDLLQEVRSASAT
jgi:transposase